MKITEINSYNDFVALKSEWNEFLNGCSDHTVFSSWEWLSTWWKHFGGNRNLLILLAEEDNKIVGIAPLMYSVHSTLGFRMGAIEFLGTPQSDYSNFIVSENHYDCQRLFIDYLKKHSYNWTCIDLVEIPYNSKNVAELSCISKPRFLCKCTYVPLPGSFDVFLNSLGHDTRYKIRRDLRRLKDNFEVAFEDYSSVDSCGIGINWLFKLHQKRLQQKGLEGAFAEEKARAFHRDVAAVFAHKGWLSLTLLRLNDSPVAALYGFNYGSKFYQYLTGIDNNSVYKKYGLGNQMNAYVISKCIEAGLCEFDFMRGGEAYKDRWSSRSRYNLEFWITKSSLSRYKNQFYNGLAHNPGLAKLRLIRKNGNGKNGKH